MRPDSVPDLGAIVYTNHLLTYKTKSLKACNGVTNDYIELLLLLLLHTAAEQIV